MQRPTTREFRYRSELRCKDAQPLFFGRGFSTHQRWLSWRGIHPTNEYQPMLIINNDDVAKLLTMGDCIRVQEEAFKKLPFGGAIHRPRIDIYMPCERPDG